MATIQPSVDFPTEGVTRVTWSNVSNADTAAPYKPRLSSGAIGNVEFSGTFGSATATLGSRNLDSGVLTTLKDMVGTNISLTDVGMVDFSTGALWIAPEFAGGTGSQSLTVTMVLRG